jgi:hypothetical protein
MGSLSRGASTGRGRMEGYQSFARCANLLFSFPSPHGKTHSFWKDLFFFFFDRLTSVIKKHVKDNVSMLSSQSTSAPLPKEFRQRDIEDSPPVLLSGVAICMVPEHLLFWRCQRFLKVP